MAKPSKPRRGFMEWLLGVQPQHPLLQETPPEETASAPSPTPPSGIEGPDGALKPCSICGGTEFRWGWLESGLYGTGKGTQSEAANQARFVRQKTRFGDFVGIRARLCAACRHVELFAGQTEEEEE